MVTKHEVHLIDSVQFDQIGLYYSIRTVLCDGMPFWKAILRTATGRLRHRKSRKSYSLIKPARFPASLSPTCSLSLRKYKLLDTYIDLSRCKIRNRIAWARSLGKINFLLDALPNDKCIVLHSSTLHTPTEWLEDWLTLTPPTCTV